MNIILSPALVVLTLSVGCAQSLPHALPHAWQPDSIVWQMRYPNGTRYALLEGSRDRPGESFTYAFFIPAGFWDKAHQHTTDARVTVVRGTLYLGYGSRINKLTARRYPIGSYLLVPGGDTHFDGSSEDTIIIGTATGVWKTVYVEQE